MSETTLIKCDQCEQIINSDEFYINASVYGVDICFSCFQLMDAHEIIKKLGLDDIKVMKPNEWDAARKIISFPNMSFVLRVS